MNDLKPDFLRASYLCLTMLAMLLISSPSVPAATLWTGRNISFTQSASSGSDVILPGKVVLTRGGSQVLFNTAAGETVAGLSSPVDTEWAFGTLTNFSTLTYQSLESMRNGDLALLILNQPMVMHLINEDIYLSVTFTAWGQHGAGGFSYTRSTAVVSTKPTVSITSPSDGAVFSAPASLHLTATATVSGGRVTNVSYFAGSTRLGSAIVSPFVVTGTISTPGAYDLTAVAIAAGGTSTSAVVNITVVAAPTTTITAPADGAVFTAPANVTITADANVGDATVTNVSFFGNATLLGSAQSPPFTLTATNLSAGNYSLTTVATASGISSTSSVVNISVVSSVAVSLSSPVISNGLFSFSYSASPGASYIVQRSADLLDWVSVVTNVAESNPVLFSDTFDPSAPHFYRIGRLAGP
jgi:hypothetical protein